MRLLQGLKKTAESTPLPSLCHRSQRRCNYLSLCVSVHAWYQQMKTVAFSKGLYTCASVHESTCVGLNMTKQIAKWGEKTFAAIRRETRCACQTVSSEEVQKEGLSILSSCLDITAVTLFITFCRQSALVAEAQFIHRRGLAVFDRTS